jgi:putative ABC transport system substrate-binding protein
MRRRAFIAGIGSAAAWPLVARGQKSRMPVIGRISMGTTSQSDSTRPALVRGLNETGFFVDQNVSIEQRTANGQVDRLPALVADLVQRKVDVISGNSSVAVAAKAATSTIPIVFVTAVDPVANGLVASFNHPGGNVTGVRLRAGEETTAKLIELVHELLPAATTIGC